MVCSQWPYAEAVLGMPKMVSVVCDEASFSFSSTALYTCSKSDLIVSHKERCKSFGTPSARRDLCFASLLTAVFSSCYETGRRLSSSTQGHIVVASQLPIACIRSVCTTREADASVKRPVNKSGISLCSLMFCSSGVCILNVVFLFLCFRDTTGWWTLGISCIGDSCCLIAS